MQAKNNAAPSKVPEGNACSTSTDRNWITKLNLDNEAAKITHINFSFLIRTVVV